jgi:short-subunit dehydrogenase
MDIRGKVAVITGASKGIGASTARRFAAEGAKVVLAARSTDKLKTIEEELHGKGFEAFAVTTDMCNKKSINAMIESAFKRYGQIDILINNAGQAAAGAVAEVNPEHLRAILDLNIFGPLYALQAVVPKMHKNGGLIINVSSMVSKMRIPGLAAYACTKSALNMLSDTARIELAADNIRVITIYPRMTSTDFGKNSLGDRGMRQEQRAHPSVPVDTPEFVAGRILDAAVKEPAEQFMDI